jgi:predicted kinase
MMRGMSGDLQNAYVVISGPPGSGKTTLSRQVAEALGLPLLAKDTIKEALMTVLEVPDVDSSRTLGRAAVAALYAVAAEAGRGVLESAWHRQLAVIDLAALPGAIVEVFCRCDQDVAQARYVSRSATRVAGHFDGDRLSAELWNEDVGEPVAGGWPVIEVDTNGPVDVDVLITRVEAALSSQTDRRA